MLNVACPACQHVMTLATPKVGKFAILCKGCQTRFQLLIKQADDQSFQYQTAKLPKQTPKDSSSSSKASLEQTAVDTDTQVDEKLPKAEKEARKEPTVADRGEMQETRHDDTPDTAKAASAQPKSDATSFGRLGPYRLLRILGQGGMGSVYLANQTSLDRQVALKVVKSQLNKKPSMLARFTREAYAAAQLIHPNVVQIYDMGDDRGNCYFSMELVDGSSLHDLVRKQKRLDPEQAASYILHAARGLQCAHNAGMVHRDIKPANLLINQDGIVKVADLGLVKVPDQEEIEGDVEEMVALSASQDLTRVGTAVGTPYYMAPEQARDAGEVDHRADIYSLGCTFYVLLTGRRPFDGTSAEEIVSKHHTAPLVAPNRIVERVPESLSDIVAKMMAKRPDERYQKMGELIEDLENYLGIATTAAFTPDEADADTIEQCAKSFSQSPLIKLRGVLPLACVAGTVLLAILMFFLSWRWATGMISLLFMGSISYFIISGMRDRTVLFEKTRELVFRSGVLNWLKWAAAGLLLIVASFLVGTFVHWLILGLIGVSLGMAYYFGIDSQIAKSRGEPLRRAEQLIRKMRLKGMEEATIQMFVAKYCGNHWEEFFEHLFGYPAKRRVRDELSKSDTGKKKPKFRAWRDSLHDQLERRIDALATDDEKKHLQKVEQAGLQAEGVSPAEAKEQAAQMAAALVDHADSLRVAALQKRILELDPEAQRLQKRLKIKAMLAEARSGKYQQQQTMMQRMTPTLDRLFGSYTRFLLGCCLVVGCLMWARQNGLLEQIQDSAIKAQRLLDAENAETASEEAQSHLTALGEALNVKTDPLSFPIFGGLFYNFNALIAGLILVGSTIVFGWRMSLFALPAAFIALCGSSLGIPELIPLDVAHVEMTSASIGIGLFVVGIVFGRAED